MAVALVFILVESYNFYDYSLFIDTKIPVLPNYVIDRLKKLSQVRNFRECKVVI